LNKIIIIALIGSLLLFGCNNTKYITVKHVKPVNRNRFYNPKKDKRKKKVKYVKVKILRKSPEVKAPRHKAKKTKKVEPAKVVNEIKAPTNAPDSTGTL
jgi:PBP1b-binding outer membrane lipoprotein LpoB